MFGGKSSLFNIGTNANASPNPTSGGMASVDISSASALTIEFWFEPSQIFQSSGLADGTAFFLGNNNSYIHFSSYNGTPAINPTVFCFNMVVVANGVQATQLNDPG